MDKRHAKKLKRAKKKKKDKKLAAEQQAKTAKQMNMFDRMPSRCSACSKEFPKTREAHMTWRVTVRNREQQVRLFCHDCLEKAKQLFEGEENGKM